MNRARMILLWAGIAAVAAAGVIYAAALPYRDAAARALLAGFVLLLSWAVLSRSTLLSYSRRRSARYGANTAVTVLAFLAIIVVAQALSARYTFRYDLTRNQRFSLAPQTVSVLQALDKDVSVYAFFQSGSPAEHGASDLLEQFVHRSGRIEYEIIDPDQRPRAAKEKDVYAFGTTVVESGPRRKTLPQLTEETLLNAVVQVTRDTVKVVCFVRGHGEREPSDGERDGYSIAAAALEREGLNVRSLSLFEAPSVPEDCALLVVAAPRRDYRESEIGKVEEYLDRGAPALFLIEPHIDLPLLEGLLGRFGIRVNDDAVVDPYSRVFGGDYSVAVVTEYEPHPITRDFTLATFFPSARSVALSGGGAEGVSAAYLARTGKNAWGETDLELIDRGQAVRSEEDNLGPVAVAAVARRLPASDAAGGDGGGGETRVAVFGDADFAANSSFHLSGNADLFLNVVDYLTEDEDLISIRPKSALGDRLFLSASQGRFIFLVSVVLLPAAVLGFGVTVWVKRRRRG